jgi:uncharacterized membrane protein
VGKLFDACPLVLLYLGRLFNCLFAALVCRQAIKTIPVQKQALTLLGLMPMTLYLFASLSPDTIAIALCFLFLAEVLRARSEQTLPPRRAMGVVFLAILIGVSKAAYAPLTLCCLLLLELPDRPLSRKIALCAATIGAGFAADLLWAKATAGIFSLGNPRLISPQQAGEFARHNPGTFILMVFANLGDYGWFYLHSFVGILGWLNLPLAAPFALAYLALILSCAITGERQQFPLHWQSRCLLAGVGLGVVLLIVASQFFIWTRIGSSKIGMAQGRYFIPVAPVLLLSLHGILPWPGLGRRIEKLLPYFVLGSLSYTLLAIVEHYY